MEIFALIQSKLIILAIFTLGIILVTNIIAYYSKVSTILFIIGFYLVMIMGKLLVDEKELANNKIVEYYYHIQVYYLQFSVLTTNIITMILMNPEDKENNKFVIIAIIAVVFLMIIFGVFLHYNLLDLIEVLNKNV